MSSCFLCDTSHAMVGNDHYDVVYAEGQVEKYYIKYMPIMIGSSGFQIDRQGDIVDCGTDQQHTNDKTQNYVSYRVKKIEFRSSFSLTTSEPNTFHLPNYIILFKVPMREPIFDYYFTVLKNFILYSEPESVLAYCVCPRVRPDLYTRHRSPDKYDLIVNKPFIVGPNDYVGVLYFFSGRRSIESSARVLFDVV